MRNGIALGLMVTLLASQAVAQEPRKEATCIPTGKPAQYEGNNFGDLGWWVDDCDIARLEGGTPTRDAENNMVTGTRICRWREPHTPEDLCYEFSHDDTTGDTAIPLRTRREFDSALGMVKRPTEPAFDVCLVKWRWGITDQEFEAVNSLAPTACGVHSYAGMARCIEITTAPPPPGYSYCASRCEASSRDYRTVSMDNGSCAPLYVPPDLSFLSNPCWPLGCPPGQANPPPPPPPPPPVHKPVTPDPPLCPPGTSDPICLAYQTVFNEHQPDKAGYEFWQQHLVDDPPANPDDPTQDPDFLVHFQNGCGTTHCDHLCSQPGNQDLLACNKPAPVSEE